MPSQFDSFKQEVKQLSVIALKLIIHSIVLAAILLFAFVVLWVHQWFLRLYRQLDEPVVQTERTEMLRPGSDYATLYLIGVSQQVANRLLVLGKGFLNTQAPLNSFHLLGVASCAFRAVFFQEFRECLSLVLRQSYTWKLLAEDIVRQCQRLHEKWKITIVEPFTESRS